MKKLLLTQLLLLFTIVAFSQTAPTKEETIKWIKEKINAYGNTKKENSGAAGDIQNSLIGNQIKSEFIDNGKIYCTFYVNVFDIIDYSKSQDCLILRTNGNRVKKFCSYENSTVSHIEFLIDWDAEPNLKNRFIKALQTLIEYNNSDVPKETF